MRPSWPLRWRMRARSSSLGQTEAARQGEQLRTALLDAVTHALRTPLTSIKASVTNLLSNSGLVDAQKHELLTIINEETDRLNHLWEKPAKWRVSTRAKWSWSSNRIPSTN